MTPQDETERRSFGIDQLEDGVGCRLRITPLYGGESFHESLPQGTIDIHLRRARRRHRSKLRGITSRLDDGDLNPEVFDLQR